MGGRARGFGLRRMLWCDSFAFFYCFFVNLCLLIPFLVYCMHMERGGVRIIFM